MAIKKLLLLLLIVPLVFAIQSCGKGAGSGYTPPGSGPGQPTYIKLKPSSNVAQTNGCINFFAEVHDENGELLANIPVTFTNLSEPLGVILDRCGGIEIHTPVTTDGWGRAKITLYSTTPGFATILAQLNTGLRTVRDQKTVFFSSTSLTLLPFMTLDVDGNNNGIYNEPSDFILFEPGMVGDNEVLIRATVYNRFGQPEPFSVVTFGSDFPYKVGSSTTCSDGTTECEVTFPFGNTPMADINGQAFVTVRVDPITLRDITSLLNITAVADNGAANLVTLFLDPIFIENVNVSANPEVISTGGNSAITTGVTLNTGQPTFDGTSVSFTTCDAALCAPEAHCTLCPLSPPCGSVEPFAQTTDGQATGTFDAPAVPNTCRVTATAGGVTGSTDILVTDTLTVTPDSINVNGTVGGIATFTIYNGAAPYTVVSDSSDTTFDPVPANVLSSGDTFTVTVPAGTEQQSIEYSVRDSVGDEVTVSVDITPDALSVLPSSVEVDGIAGGTATFTVYGGAPVYTITSDDLSLPPDQTTVTNSGDTFTVTVPALTRAKSVQFTVRDSAGATVTATVNIIEDTEALAIDPDTFDIGTLGGGSVDIQYIVTGGAAPYTVYFTLPMFVDVASPTQDGQVVGVAGTNNAVFTVRYTWGAGVSATFQMIVVDSYGDSVSSTVTMAP